MDLPIIDSDSADNNNNVKRNAQSVWHNCDAVCFDVDSTVTQTEGIDELANFLGKKERVAELTAQAMGGSMTFRESLEKRLNILTPSLSNVNNFNTLETLALTTGIQELIDDLRLLGVDVYLVSGGFKRLITPIAQRLGIPDENIFANQFIFNTDGSYQGFDVNQPTSAAGGKPKVAQLLKDSQGYRNLVFIGDGATDMEASPPADAFIGFGGNVIREKVKLGAPWFVTCFSELQSLLRKCTLKLNETKLK